ncbi:MAG TPA: lytic murein transglycosylase [Maritimibacter sp.]|nr:lytic murein transglycosylase [Maritimibacter sp.]
MNAAHPLESADKEFRTWVEHSLRPRATGRMISADTFEDAMAQARFFPDVLERQKNQKEFVLPIWDYLDIAASEERIRNGRQALRGHRARFIEIEKLYGVEPEVVAAIWGLETGYGANRGAHSVVSALATLAWRGRRASFFEDELIAALRILQSGHVTVENMIGSWAGAMGHGQFMPSSFLDFAVDLDGDRKADIWSDAPDDAIASIANYLKKHGWRSGQPWGYEVSLPPDFDFGKTGLDQVQSTQDWHDLGVRVASGGRLPDYGPASVLVPAGAQGAAFIVLRNFHVILRYNRSEFYALGIGHLSDRIAGDRGFVANWPTNDPLLSRDEVSEVQVRLSQLGFDTQGVDGLRGPNTTRALRAFQAENGLTADGFLTHSVLQRLRDQQA